MKAPVPYPLIRLLFPYGTGILIAMNTGASSHLPWILFLLMMGVWGTYVFYVARKISYSTRWIFGAMLFLMIGVCGYEMTLLRTPSLAPDHFMNQTPQPNRWVLRILGPPQARERSVRAEAEVVACGDTLGLHPASGHIMLYFLHDSSALQLTYGDLLVSGLCPAGIPPPANPGAFDYQRYMSFRGIYHQAFLQKDDYRKIGCGYTNPLFRLAYDARSKILTLLDQNGLGGQEFAVTSALLIGYTDKLDQDLLTAYSGTGAMHILSVSGMHVGLIYAVLNMLLWFFDRFRHGFVPKALLLLLFIWAYATLTGLSPSVLRAASMFSIIVIGQAVNRAGDIFNSLAASALLLLIVNPFFLMDIGFQLSYVAVIGIISLQRPISSWWTPRYWLLRQGWSLTSVSIAAQLATFPLGLYYFQQFPNYFLLTNLVALPLSSAVIYLALLVLAASPLPVLSVWLGQLLSWLVILLNNSISFLEKLPGSVTRGAFITGPETLILYGALLFFLIYCYRKKSKALLFALGAFLLLGSSFFWRSLQHQFRQQLVIYSDSKSTAVECIHGRQQVFLADSLLLNDTRKRDFVRGGLADAYGLKSYTQQPWSVSAEEGLHQTFFHHQRYLQFCHYRMVRLSKAEKAAARLRVDALLVTGNPDMNVNEMLACYDTKLLVIGADNWKKNKERWKRQCAESGITCWPLAEAGALIIDMAD